MAGPDRYYTARVHDNADPEERGRLTLEIPGLLGEGGIWPDWIEPRAPGGAGPGATGLHWIPPNDAIVVVESDHGREALRWLGSTLGSVNTLPALLTGANYPSHAGISAPDGSALLVLGPDLAVLEANDVRLGSSAASSAAALGPLVETELSRLGSVFSAWVPVPADGGAALKALLTTLLLTWPGNTGASKVKAE